MRVAANIILLVPIALMILIIEFICYTVIHAYSPELGIIGLYGQIVFSFSRTNNATDIIFVSAIVTCALGFYLAWIVHTREFRTRPILIAFLMLPLALQYDAIALTMRNLELRNYPNVSMYAAVLLTLVIRYLPLAFVLSFMSISRFAPRSAAVGRNLGVTEGNFLLRLVIPKCALSIVVQLLFLVQLFATDATGIGTPSEGRLFSVGNQIRSWLQTVENRHLAFALTLALILFSGLALGTANIWGWWQRTLIKPPSPIPPTSRFDPGVMFAWTVTLLSSGISVIPALMRSDRLGAAFVIFCSDFFQFFWTTVEYLLLGFVFTWLSTIAVYIRMQERRGAGIGVLLIAAVALSTVAVVTPPVVRGELFRTVTAWTFNSSGNIFWVSVWSWLYTFVIVATVAALHPISRSSRFLEMAKNLDVPIGKQIVLATRHSLPVFLIAYSIFVFITLFDTSIAGLVSGFDKPLSMWLAEHFVMTLDRNMIALSICISLSMLLPIVFVSWKIKGNHERV